VRFFFRNPGMGGSFGLSGAKPGRRSGRGCDGGPR
jgi:hypothetical protein